MDPTALAPHVYEVIDEPIELLIVIVCDVRSVDDNHA